MLTKAQSDAQLIQAGAQYRATRDGTEWWVLRDGRWVGRRAVGQGYFELRVFAANACNC